MGSAPDKNPELHHPPTAGEIRERSGICCKSNPLFVCHVPECLLRENLADLTQRRHTKAEACSATSCGEFRSTSTRLESDLSRHPQSNRAGRIRRGQSGDRLVWVVCHDRNPLCQTCAAQLSLTCPMLTCPMASVLWPRMVRFLYFFFL